MTDASSSDAADLAYLKRLAEAGRGEPAPFLLLIAVFGGAYGLWSAATCVGVFVVAGVSGVPSAPNEVVQTLSASLFTAANIAFVATAIWTIWRTFVRHRHSLSRSAIATWSAAFAALVAVVAATFAGADTSHPLFDAGGISVVSLILWGAAWWATAINSDRRWLLSVAIGSFAAAIALAAVGPGLWGFPLIAASLIFLAFVPAVLLMRGRGR